MATDSEPDAGTPYPELVAVLTGEHGLTYREEYILRLRFGLGKTGRPYTLDDIGFLLGVTGERARQLERAARAKVGLSDLRSPAAKGLSMEELWAQPAVDLPPEADALRDICFGKAVRDLLARRGDIELTFIQHRDSGVVHVITPVDSDAEHDEEYLDSDVAFGDQFARVLTECLVGACVTLCGYRARRHLGGFEAGDKRVHEFDDDQLCRACVRELGPHSARAFEHPQPDQASGRD